MKTNIQFRFAKLQNCFQILPGLFVDWPISKYKNGFSIQLIWIRWAVGIRFCKEEKQTT